LTCENTTGKSFWQLRLLGCAVVDQELTAYVRIDNAFAAALARHLLPIFGRLADRKLSEGFAVTAKVAEWAVAHPDEFCDWLRREIEGIERPR
jgi:hypothetical protein